MIRMAGAVFDRIAERAADAHFCTFHTVLLGLVVSHVLCSREWYPGFPA